MIWLDDVRLDVRHAARLLWRAPAFSAMAIVVLALGMGGTVAIWSVVNAVFFRPLPVRAPEQLVYVYQRWDDGHLAPTSRDLEFFRQHADVFDAVTTHMARTSTVSVDGSAAHVVGEIVAANYFDVLGVAAVRGRTFVAAEDDPSAPELAIVISDDFWKRQFHGAPDVIGRTVKVDGKTMMVIGVAEAGFTGLTDPWAPAQFWVTSTQLLGAVARNWQAGLIGRIKPGVPLDHVGQVVDVVGRQFQREESQRTAKEVVRFRTSINPYVVRPVTSVSLPYTPEMAVVPARLMAGLMLIAGSVLLIAATNIAGLLLARGVTRTGELAVRRALGAGGSRLVRHLLTESLLLSVVSGVAGLGLGRLLMAIYGATAREQSVIHAPFDLRVVLFAVGVCVVTGLLVGLAPARQALNVNVVSALAGGVAATGRGRRRLRHAIVVPQVALALMLLIAAGAYIRVLLAAETNTLGYRIDDDVLVLSAEMQTVSSRVLSTPAEYEEAAARRRRRSGLFDENLTEALRHIPGLAAAGVASGLPLFGPNFFRPAIVTRESLRAGRRPAAGPNPPWAISPGVLRAMGITVLRGRDFDDRDRADSPRVAMINATLADRLWPGQNPIGRSIALHGNAASPELEDKLAWIEVVGVVNDIAGPFSNAAERPSVMIPIAQGWGNYLVMVVARIEGRPSPSIIEALKQAIVTADPDRMTEVFQVATMDRLLSDMLYQRRMAVAILATSGVTGLVLALIGLYGVITYSIEQRRREIGIRTALGAARGDVIRLVLREGLSIAAVGSAIGAAVSFVFLRTATSLGGAAGVTPKVDALTYVVVPLIVLPVVLLACYVPARRAARMDSLVALRQS